MAERDLVAGVIQLANLLNRRLAPVFEKSSITPQQWAVLLAIAAEPEPMTLVAIARSLAVSKQNMTGMMNRLEQLGLVEREDDPADRRTARMKLTRRGRALTERAAPAYEQWRDELGATLPERDLQTLTRSVNRLIEKLEDN